MSNNQIVQIEHMMMKHHLTDKEKHAVRKEVSRNLDPKDRLVAAENAIKNLNK